MLQNIGEKLEIEIPVLNAPGIKGMWIKGRLPGKTLIVTAGVHGCEYIGIQAVRELSEEIKPDELNGSVIFIPLINENGFYEGAKQIVPEDKKNLNRCFPGSTKGSVTSRMAKALEMYLYDKADFLVDLHGGDVNESMTPLVFFPVGAGENVELETRKVIEKLSVEYCIPSKADKGLYSYAAKCGIPALLIERGGGGRWSVDEVNSCKQNICEIMDVLSIKKCKKLIKGPAEVAHVSYEEAVEKGFWYCLQEVGGNVEKGELLGRLTDSSGEIIREYKAEFDGVILYLTHALGVKKEEPLIAYGKL